MKRSLSNGQQGGEVVMTGAVTIARVAELKKLLQEAMGQASPVRVDLGQVEQIDTAGIQLLCAAHRMACNGGKTLEITEIAGCIRQLVLQAGFAHAAVCEEKQKTACLWAKTAEDKSKA